MSKASMGNIIKLLEFIRRNTDREHPITPQKLRELMGEDTARVIMGDKGTYSRRLNEIADGYNTDSDGNVLPKEQWKIIFAGYGRTKGDNKRNGKAYYSHPVSEEELGFLVHCIRHTHNFTKEEKESFERRIKDALGSRYYQDSVAFTDCVIKDLDAISDDNAEIIESNIERLRYYIKKEHMTDITVSQSPDATDETATYKYQVSPYRIVHKDGYYWLIANWHERPAETYVPKEYHTIEQGYRYARFWPWYTDKLTAFRIDYIEKIEDAHVPAEQTIHWTMTRHLLPAPVDYRHTNGGLRKARKRDNMIVMLKKYDRLSKNLEHCHCKDINFDTET